MKNVLVVDSDQSMLKTLSGILRTQGGFLNVFTATNTQGAVEQQQTTPVDIVITAIRLPKVDGFRLVAKFAKDYPSVKVIVMTKDANPLMRATIRRFSSAVHLDQSHDITMLTKRVFTELQIDYGGRVRGINLSSFLQMMELEGCSCSLRVTSKESFGTLWLENGEVIAAQSKKVEGKKAALDIVSWKNVFIDIDYAPHHMERQISVPLMVLILESNQRDDEKRSRGTNNRDHERYDLLVALDYDIDKMTRQCSLRDISLSGAFIETDQELKQGEKIKLLLRAPSLQSSCSLNAIVVRREGRGVGVNFLVDDEKQQQVIQMMIDNCIPSRLLEEDASLPPATVV